MGILLYECLGEFGLLKCDRLLLQEKNPFFSIRKVQERKAAVLFLTLQICHPHSCVFFLVFVAAGWLYHNRLTWQAEYTHLQLWTGPFWHFPKDLTCFDGFACLLGLFSPILSSPLCGNEPSASKSLSFHSFNRIYCAHTSHSAACLSYCTRIHSYSSLAH